MNLTEIPRGQVANLGRYFKYDLVSGFLVFLIALPLCLGISIASGFPPIAGIFTAIIGSVVATCISDSEMTIKGPAAGLIVIAIGCIEDFGGNGTSGGWDGADMAAYQAALAVGVAAAVMQVIFGFFRAGIIGEFFPSATVHGMLAAIGVTIIAKQVPDMLGVIGANGPPLEMLRMIPDYFAKANPAIALIGLSSLAIMFFWPLMGNRFSWAKKIPSPLLVLLVAIPLGMAFDLLSAHSYVFAEQEYQIGEQFLVKMPDRAFGMFDEITFPDFGVLSQFKAWKWAMMFFIIGTLESLLSSKAIDLLDPWKRKTNMDRDVVGVGVANLCAAMVGGLPMISEIVRSKANIDNGARTRFADMWHGMFLLACVALIPTLLHRIPLAALAAMLVYTGYRLAHPSEFLEVWRTGREKLAIFVVTFVMVLATDLLVGVIAGVALKMLMHVFNGVPLRSLFNPALHVEALDEKTTRIVAQQSAVFSNWIPLRREIEELGFVQGRNVIVDLADAHLVDQAVFEKLDELERDFDGAGLRLEIRGQEMLKPLGDIKRHQSPGRRGLRTMRRMTVMIPEPMVEGLLEKFSPCGVNAYTRLPCRTETLGKELPNSSERVRLEFLVPTSTCKRMLDVLRGDYLEQTPLEVCVENVDVMQSQQKD